MRPASNDGHTHCIVRNTQCFVPCQHTELAYADSISIYLSPIEGIYSPDYSASAKNIGIRHRARSHIHQFTNMLVIAPNAPVMESRRPTTSGRPPD